MFSFHKAIHKFTINIIGYGSNKFKIITIIIAFFAVQEIDARGEGVWDAKVAQDQIMSHLKESEVLSEQKKIAKQVLEKVKKEQDQYKNYGNLQNFKKSDILKNEKLADQVYQKVRQEEKKYKKIADNVEEKVKKEEAWSKKFVNDANQSIYRYSQNVENQNKNTNSDNAEINHILEGYSQILKNNKTNQMIPDGFYIAVSLSMPKALLVGLSERASKIGARLIMRGLKNNSFKETVKVIKELSESGIAIDINPKIFRSYEIKQVPAFILITGDKSDILHGNVSLSYVLNEFKDKGDTKEGARK